MNIKIISKKRKPSVHKKFDYIDVAVVSINDNKNNITLGFSKYDTETDWYLDYRFINKLPDFCHGEGSRCCKKQVAAEVIVSKINEKPYTDY